MANDISNEKASTIFPSALRATFLAALMDGTRSIVELDDGWFCFDTPFLNRINDSICIYAKNDHGVVRFSDDGEVLDLYILGGKTMDDAKALAAQFNVKGRRTGVRDCCGSGAGESGAGFCRFSERGDGVRIRLRRDSIEIESKIYTQKYVFIV